MTRARPDTGRRQPRPRPAPAARPARPAAERAMDRVQKPLIEAFRGFYDEEVAPALRAAAGESGTVPARELPVYAFFGHGLVHWAVKALEFFPPDRRLVLLASGLDRGELAWLLGRTRRPVHHVPRAIDDKTAWEMLFAVNRTGFGWMDVDVLVRRPELLDELAEVPAGAALNCLWAFDAADGVRLPYPHFVFVGGEALADPRLGALGLGPGTYVYPEDVSPGGPRGPGRFADFACHRTLTPEQAAAIDRALGAPRGERPHPYFNERPFFEALQAWTLAAYDLGWRLNEVRTLGARRDEDHWSAEVVHVSSVAHVTRPDFPFERLDPSPRKRYAMLLVADYLLLRGYWDELPPGYRELALERRGRAVPLLEELLRRPLDDEALRRAARSLMTHTVSEDEIAGDPRWGFVRAAARPVEAA